jgi:2-deoxy-D-gluconate 3-dehydrogenase
MILDSFNLDGQVALVTGTTRGLGQAAAIALAEAGADIALLDRADAGDTAEQIRASCSGTWWRPPLRSSARP